MILFNRNQSCPILCAFVLRESNSKYGKYNIHAYSHTVSPHHLFILLNLTPYRRRYYTFALWLTVWLPSQYIAKSLPAILKQLPVSFKDANIWLLRCDSGVGRVHCVRHIALSFIEIHQATSNTLMLGLYPGGPSYAITIFVQLLGLEDQVH